MGPWQPQSPWWGTPPQTNTVFVPVTLPPDFQSKRKKEKVSSLKDQIQALEMMKKFLEGDKPKKEEKKEEPKPTFNFPEFLKIWGLITFFGPPICLGYFILLYRLFDTLHK